MRRIAALAAFQRTLVTGPSPLDRYLAGDKSALSDAALRGMELFTGEADCVRCHKGPHLSDGELYRLGLAARAKGWPPLPASRKIAGGSALPRYAMSLRPGRICTTVRTGR